MKKIVALVLSLVMVLGLATTAVAYTEDTYDLYKADATMSAMMAAKTPATNYDGVTVAETGAKANTDGSGNVAYLTIAGTTYATKTTAPTVSSYAVCADGKTDVLYYVNLSATSTPDAFYYSEEVKAFSNWGLKCGQFDNTAFTAAQKADDYYMGSDFKVYRAVDATGDENTNVLLDGTVVSGTALGYTIDHSFVANNFKYDATTGANVPTSAICTTCLMESTAIYKDGKAPAGSLVKPLNANGDTTTWVVVPGAAAAAPSTPAGDKVESAETFDAGIAMYVGMSVMAAAGSAVVLKKKG